jgi:F0F1-type ATP synthase alpha subunit
MKLKELNANQIVTLNDFPVHNLHILKIFFKVFKEGYAKMIPACPIMHKKLLTSGFDENLKKQFMEFEKKHPKAEYFLLDGSHKTTAANLTGNKIKVMIFESDRDIEEAKELVEIGELFSLATEDTIKDIIKGLGKHFTKKPGFQTIEEKTEKMVRGKVIPSYMIKYYGGN